MKLSENILESIAEENLVGDFHPLMDQLGSADGLKLAGKVNASLRFAGITNFAGLRKFLQSYRAEILIPLELPLICKAFAHASKNEFSELIALDQQLASESRLKLFASASKRIGQMQLQRLRPLRDQRGLQRYVRAVDAGEAHGWHTLIYGVTLASFSFPLRQGLMNYTQQVLSGFVRCPAKISHFPSADSQKLLEENIAAIPPLIDGLLTDCQFIPRIQIA